MLRSFENAPIKNHVSQSRIDETNKKIYNKRNYIFPGFHPCESNAPKWNFSKRKSLQIFTT